MERTCSHIYRARHRDDDSVIVPMEVRVVAFAIQPPVLLLCQVAGMHSVGSGEPSCQLQLADWRHGRLMQVGFLHAFNLRRECGALCAALRVLSPPRASRCMGGSHIRLSVQRRGRNMRIDCQGTHTFFGWAGMWQQSTKESNCHRAQPIAR